MDKGEERRENGREDWVGAGVNEEAKSSEMRRRYGYAENRGPRNRRPGWS